MNRLTLPVGLILVSVLVLSVQTAWGANDEPIPKRVREIAAMLNDSPQGLGKPADDRAVWSRIGQIQAFQDTLAATVKLIGKPVTALPDSLFLDFSRTGNRIRFEIPHRIRRDNLCKLVIAECIEDKGRFIPDIERYIRAICEEKTWVYPAHDRQLLNFTGKTITIDLFSAMISQNLATIHYLLGERLSPEVRALIYDTINKRTFEPYLQRVQTEEDLFGWMTGTGNWNSVCHDGVIGSALALIESREERAWFLYGMERYLPYYLQGFSDDGNCSEGLSYWNFGFGHYLMLSEAVKQATGGAWDLLDNEKVRNIALYPSHLEILPDIYPSFADCLLNAYPFVRYMRFVNRRFGFGQDRWEKKERTADGLLYELALYEITDPLADAKPAVKSESGGKIRHWFENGGILICRPSPDVTNCLGAAIKGGNNDEHHNHNDVGSYVVALGTKALLLDPAGEVYTGRTFSDRRYDSDVLNSFGHPVPVVAGKLQKTGPEAQGIVVRKEFSDTTDILALDIASAYDVPELKTLLRTFVFSREGRGSLTVTDHAEFSEARDFETALITFSEYQQLGPGSLLVFEDGNTVKVDVTANGKDFEFQVTEIREDLPVGKYPMRLGFALKEPARTAEFTITITPYEQ